MDCQVTPLIVIVTSGTIPGFSVCQHSMQHRVDCETLRKVACKPQKMFKLIPGALKKKGGKKPMWLHGMVKNVS